MPERLCMNRAAEMVLWRYPPQPQRSAMSQGFFRGAFVAMSKTWVIGRSEVASLARRSLRTCLLGSTYLLLASPNSEHPSTECAPQSGRGLWTGGNENIRPSPDRRGPGISPTGIK
jgi:hypothetical protein